MSRSPLVLALVLAAFAGVGAHAARSALTPGERYVRFRADAAAGRLDAANEQAAALLTLGDAGDALTERAYRQAIEAGDVGLAVRAARLLDARNALPADAPLLFAILAIRAGDWTKARAETDRLQAGRLFAFLAPLARAWIAEGAGDADPLAIVDAARGGGVAAGYAPVERVLLLAAAGRLDDATAGMRGQQAAGTRARLLVAAAFQRAHRGGEAAALLAGDEAPLIAARARLAAGRPIGIALDGTGDGGTGGAAAGGVAELLAQVAVDFNRPQLEPVALAMARFATVADPANARAWLAVAGLLGATDRPAAGIAALDHVHPDDPFAADAETLRVSLLIEAGDKRGALDRALAATRAPGAADADWARAGEVYLALDRPKEAGDAYARAIALAAGGPADRLWPLLLQQGTALEQAGDWPAAKAALARAAGLAPGEPAVLNHLGYSLLSRREEMGRAAALIAAASNLRPDDPAITDSAGWARFAAGDLKGALPLLETAAAGDPADPSINEHLGDVYWTAGRRMEARYAWSAAEIGAEDKDLGRLRAKISDGLTRATASP